MNASVFVTILVATSLCGVTALDDNVFFGEILPAIENDASLDSSNAPHLILKRLADEIIKRFPNATIEQPITEVTGDETVVDKFAYDLPGGKHEQMTIVVDGERQVIGMFSYKNEATGEERTTTYKTDKNGTKSKTRSIIRAQLARSLVG